MTGRLLADESYFDSRRGGPGWKPWFVPGESRPLSALGPRRRRRDREGIPPGAPAGRRPRPRRHEARAPGGWPLAVRLSPPLEEILHRMDVASDNYLAEMRAEAARCIVARQGTDRGRRSVVRAILAERKIPLAGPDRRTARAYPSARPPDPEGARHDPAADLGRPRPAAGRPPDRRSPPDGTLARPLAQRSRALRRTSDDARARQRVGARRASSGTATRFRFLVNGRALVVRSARARRTGSRRSWRSITWNRSSLARARAIRPATR